MKQTVTVVIAIVILVGFVIPVAAKPTAAIEDNLISCFDMEEGTGSRPDYVETSTSGGLWPRTGDTSVNRMTAGLNGNANQFDGSFSLNAWSPALYNFNAPAKSFTLSVEVYPNEMTGSLHWIIGKRVYSHEQEYDLYFDASTRQFIWEIATVGSPRFFNVKSGTVAYNNWYVLTAWYDYPNRKLGLSVNGQEYITDVPYDPLNDGYSKPFIVGGLSDWNLMFYGKIDTLAVWGDRVLSSTDREWLLNSLLGRTCKEISEGQQAPAPSVGNTIYDGDMEQQPNSYFWYINTVNGSGDFGRLDNRNLLTVGYGDPRCNNGWQIIGNTSLCGWSILPYYNEMCRRSFAAIRQEFAWPGGVMHWRFSAKGLPSNGWDRNVNISVWVTHKFTNQQTILFDGPVPPTWTDLHGSSTSTVVGGQYIVNVFKSVSGNLEDDAFMVDDVVIDTVEVDPVACTVPIQPGNTSTPIVTNTPPPNQAGDNLINNCGFSQGDAYWTVNSGAYVIFGDNNYAHIENNAGVPGFRQQFYWPGGAAYTSFRTALNYAVYFRNISTGQTYTAATGENSGWDIFRGSVVMPAGSYEIRLHHPTTQGPSSFDDVTVSTGNYTTCDSGTNQTLTPFPTATSQRTATMFPTATSAPTSTAAPGMPTSTTRPSLTPFPTFTMVPTEKPSSTPRLPSTSTPWATWTPQPTYTPYATYTPNPAGTIEPVATVPAAPPPPPPPAYYADCNRPQNGVDIPHWLEYEKCQTLSFFSMSPNAVGTVAAVPTMFVGREPWGTIKEVQDTNKQFQDLVNQQDWTESLPGMKDGPDPSIFLQPGADNPWITGKVDFTKKSEPISQECSASLTTVVGPQLSPGMCWMFNFLREKGILPWLQLIINIIALLTLGLYIWKKWIDAGAS